MSDNYDIIKVPDPVLKQVANPVGSITADILAQVSKMQTTMYKAAGIGLAANQVGLMNRIFVMDLPEGIWQHGKEINGILTIEANYRSGEREGELVRSPKAFINPEIIWHSEKQSVYEEGCLSIPGQYGEVVRPAQVRVKYLNEKGHAQEELFDGLHSHCVQHEIDHLNGVLFIDYLSTLKRNMILRRMKKLHKESSIL